MAERRRLLARELREFKKLLLERREDILGEMNYMETKALAGKRKDASGDLSALPTHMADVAGDNYEQEVTFGLIQSEREEVREIDDALARIAEKSYGNCETCEKPIPKTRLRALPFAKLCVECKKSQELGR